MGSQRVRSDKESEKKEKIKPKKPEVKKEVKREDIVRFLETNIDGNKPVSLAIRKVKGVGFMFANAVCKKSGLGNKKLSELTETEQKNLEDMITNPGKYNLPIWLFNRRREPQTNQDKHLAVSQLDITKKLDVDEMRKLKTYKGVRHGHGLTVRGQRTRGSFRKGKAVGVSKKKARAGGR